MNLADEKCVPCEAGGKPLDANEISFYMKDVPKWQVAADGKKLHRSYTFKDFKESMRFVNRVADAAESKGHHPDISIHYNEVRLELWTHAVGGLSVNDFILAAKIDSL